ncbi:MAG TPA: DUF5017 domain-containing protein [Puia sp.]|nr:DUF5017 domain-containing protein [Puia sp.]
MKRITPLIILTLMVFSCTKKEVPSADFTVISDSVSYTAGDTTWFSFTGDPYNLTFYSGEPGHEYRFRNRTTAAGDPQLQFSTTRASGNAADTLQVLMSTDFKGIYDSADIYEAGWTDITSRAVLATSSAKASGVVDLADFVKDTQSVYLAYRYVGTTHTGAQTTWTVTAITINNVVTDGNNTFSVGTVADGAWQVVNMKNQAVKWTVSSTQLQVKGGAANSDTAETWVISRPLMLSRALPDIGVSLKNITNNAVTAYPYIYKTAGAYTATFVGTNTTVYDSKQTVKEIKVQVN